MAFFKESRYAGDFEAGIQGGLIAIIASPKFLYRAEPPPPNLKPGTTYHLSDLELASRLSFFASFLSCADREASAMTRLCKRY